MNVKTLIAGSAAVFAAVLLALVTSAAPHAASGGLVAAYGFDEGSGTVVHDSIASANNGTAANTSWTTGKFGGALTFNGTSSWVTVPDSSVLDLTKGFTLEAWVKPAVGMGTNWETILFKESLLGVVYGLYANSDAGGPAAVANSGALDVRGPSALPAGVWTHVATTWDGSTVHLYVNGTQVATRDVGGTLSASIGVLHVGGNSLAGEFFKGQIDEVRIYNQAQAQSRITGDMTTSITPSAPPADATPPSAPTGLTATNVATTSVTVNWTASTDNVGVAGYNLFSDGVAAGTATAPVTTFLNLSCGASHTFGIEAFDAAGNVSAAHVGHGLHAACPTRPLPRRRPHSPRARRPRAPSPRVGRHPATTSASRATRSTRTGSRSARRPGRRSPSPVFSAARPTPSASRRSTRQATSPPARRSSRARRPVRTSPHRARRRSFVPGTTGTTSIATSWVASTDNVGVAGYTLYRNGVSAGTATSPLFTFAGLTCGTSYTLGVEAFDAAGNVSTRTSITASTSVCPDVTPPSAPSALATGSVTRTSLVLSWTGSTDNVGVAGYRIFRDGVSAGTSATPSFSFSTLTCGTSYVLGVEAFDAAGNTSTRPAITATTSACADTTPPTAPSALGAGSVTRTSLVLSWTGSTDNVGVAGYRIFRDGVSAGTSATPSFSFSTLTCGTSYVLGVDAFDAAGNTSARPAITATTSACADTTPAECAGLVLRGHDRHDVDRDLVGRIDGQRRRHRVHAVSQRRERRDGDVAAVHVCGSHVRDELHAGRRGVRRGGQRVGARLDHGVDHGLPRRRGAFRAERARGRHPHRGHGAGHLDGIDGQRRRRRLPALP